MAQEINESRHNSWKNSPDFTYVRTADKKRFIEFQDRFFSYDAISEAIKEFSGKTIGESTSEEIVHIIEESLVDSEGAIIEGIKYDWSKIDPRTGLPKIKEARPEESIELMNKMPSRTGWIVMLQNRVNFNSVGNIRYSKKVWFDRQTGRVAPSQQEIGDDSPHFRSYILPNGGGKPQGWMMLEDYKRITGRDAR